jgi:S1-C subfamily serine protease
VLGVGLFAGWVYGRDSTLNSFASTQSTLAPLQQGTSSVATIPPLTGNNIETVQEAVIQKVSPAVVEVIAQTESGTSIGSGVIIDQRGYIVTNNHVVDGAQNIQVVLYNNTQKPAQIAGTDAADDLAILKITPPAHLVVAPLGDSSKLVVGEVVLAIGNPLGITQTVTNGIISALNRTVTEGQSAGGQTAATIPDAIQTNAAINPGNSGGALVDLQGYVIGIPTLTAIDPEFNTPASGVGFAIPSNRVRFIAEQVIQYGKVLHTGRASLGVQVEPVTPYLAQLLNLSIDQGALVVSVQSGGPAQQAGLQVGDVIVQINSTPVTDTSSLNDVLSQASPGAMVVVQIVRGSQHLTLKVTLGELAAQS